MSDILAWYILAVFAVLCLLPVGTILLLFLVMCIIQFIKRGDIAIYESNGYSTRFSFNKALNEKMRFYPAQHSMKYLKFYMNFVWPFITVSTLATLMVYLQSPSVIAHLAVLLVCVFNTVAVRFIRPFGFFANLGCLTIVSVFSIVKIFMDLGSIMILWPFAALSIIIYPIILVGTFAYYIPRRSLFLKSLAQLKAEYLADDLNRELEEMGEVLM